MTDDTDRLAARLDAVERALTDGETDLQHLDDAAALADRVARLESRVEDLERTQDRLDGAVQAVRGYAGAVRTVNRAVERRADAALAAVDRLAADEPTDLDLPDPAADDRHGACEADALPTGEEPTGTAGSDVTDDPAGDDPDAADAGPSDDGRRLNHAGDDYRRAVRQQVADAVGSRVQVVADWRPYAGASVTATFTVGPDPPTTASVRAATLTVPSGVSTGGRSPRRSPDTRTAHALADRIVAGVFPPDATRLALAGDHPTTSLVRHRYHRAATLLGTDLRDGVTSDPATTNVTRANDALAAALTDRIAADRRAAGDPTGVTGPGSVRLIVRTWGSR